MDRMLRPDLAGRAEALYNAIDQEPDRAGSEALALADEARAAGDAAAEALALRVAAAVVRERDTDAAMVLARRGLDVAMRAGLDDVADRLRVGVAGIHVVAGRVDEAHVILDEVAERDLPIAGAETLVQRGFVELLAGEFSAAIGFFDAALGRLPQTMILAGHSLSNRGLARAYLGDLVGASDDLAAAEAVYDALGCDLAVAKTRHNLGEIRFLSGDFVGALAAYTAAELELGAHGPTLAYILRDRATTLIAVGLAAEAAEDARRSAEEFAAASREGDAADSLIVEAHGLAMSGRWDAAVEIALRAEEACRAQGRPAYADQAALIAVKARPRASYAPADLERARNLTRRLGFRGALNTALDACLTAARIAVVLGDLDGAAGDLVRADKAKTSPRPDLRIAYWEAAAELHSAGGKRRLALSAVRAGLGSLEESQQTLGATEARVNVAASAERLGRIALAAARDSGGARLFEWMERVRAGALRFRPVRPSTTEVLDTEQAELRRLSRDIEEGQLRGADTAAMSIRQRQLERSIRMRLLQAPGSAAHTERVGAAEVRGALGDSVLIEYGEVDGHLLAVRVDANRCRTFDLGSVDAIRAELDHLKFGLLRLASGRDSAAGRLLVEAGAQMLDELILAPVDRTERRLVVVPTGELFTVPWTVLPSTTGRPVVVSPSASMWMAATARRDHGRGRVVVAAGPDLDHSGRELGRVASIVGADIRFDADSSTVEAVLPAIDGAALFHIACHGVFRSDNPLFSHLRVADGPLSVYDIEGLTAAPRVVVLSACDSGLAQPRPGNEWMGMASALLTMGTRSLVASVMPVPDTEATIGLMAGLHTAMKAGMAPHEALFVAGGDMDPEALVARAAFVCLGS